MDIPKIYTVVGETGEYSDWRTWDVASYFDREAAELHRTKAEEGWKEYQRRYQEQQENPTGTGYSEDPEPHMRNLWDIHVNNVSSYQDITYSVEEIIFCPHHPDEYQEELLVQP